MTDAAIQKGTILQSEEPLSEVMMADADDENNEGTLLRIPEDVEESFCEKLFMFRGLKIAQGCGFIWWGHGGVVVSNIFLSASLVFLANQEAGCLDEDDEVIENCDGRVYGFKPANLIANIAFISGVIVAILLPALGAIIDYTDKRRLFGAATVSLIMFIQAIQIGTVASTWFIMAILQAVNGVLFEVQSMVNYSFIVDIRKLVNETTLTQFNYRFMGLSYVSELLFVIIITVLSIGLNLDAVLTGQMNQGVNVLYSGITFAIGYRLLPAFKKQHDLPEGASLWTEGFKQSCRTVQKINQHYKKGLRWFLLANMFAEAGAFAEVTLAVSFLSDFLSFSSDQVGIFFIVSLIFLAIGSRVGALFSLWMNPRLSWMTVMIGNAIATTVGGLTLNRDTPTILVYVWGATIGLFLGWFYPSSNLFFSMSSNKYQQAELSGFYACSKGILVWAPPLVYSALVEADLGQNYALITVAAFFFAAFLLISFTSSWSDIVKEGNKDIEGDDEDDAATSRGDTGSEP